MTPEEELHVAVASARIAGIHPDWIAFAMEKVKEKDQQAKVLNIWTSWMEQGTFPHLAMPRT